MYETLVLGVNHIGRKKNQIIVGIVIAVMIALTAFLIPVRVYALSSMIVLLGEALISALASYGLMTAGAPVAVAILAGMGASLTVNMIAKAISAAEESGAWSEFCEKIAKGGVISNTAGKVVLSMGTIAFNKAYNWVKEHIVDHYAETKPVVKPIALTGQVLSDCVFVPEDWQGSDVGIEKTGYSDIAEKARKFGKNTLYTNIKHYYYSHGFETTHSYHLCDSKDKELFSLQAKSKYFDTGVPSIASPSIWHWMCTDLNIGKTKNGYFAFAPFGLTAVPEQGEEQQFDDVSLQPYLWYFKFGSLTEYKKLLFNADLGQVKLNSAYYNNDYIRLTLSDGKIMDKFESFAHFIWLLFNDCAKIEGCNYRTGNAWTDTQTDYTEPKVVGNDYYDVKHDTIKTTADSIGDAITNGNITTDAGADAGTVTVDVSDTAVSEITTTAATSVSDIAISDVGIVTDVAVSDAAAEVGVTSSMTLPQAFNIAGNYIQDGALTIADKFPFDVIKCAYNWLLCLVEPGEPLVIDYTWKIPQFNISVPVHIDFSKNQKTVDVINWLVIVMTGLGCILASREWLKSI